jgi:hypothetical protein
MDVVAMAVQEPDWRDVERRLGALTLKKLRPIKDWFNGNLGGATTKAEIVHTMTNQMRYWWRYVAGDIGKIRVRKVLADLAEVEGESVGQV